MAWAWLARKVRQLWLGGRAGPRRRYRRTERALTAMPSLSSSPRIHSMPRCGFSRPSWRSATGPRCPAVAARAGWPDRMRQNKRQPWPCRRSTVSGRTRRRWRRQFRWRRWTRSRTGWPGDREKQRRGLADLRLHGRVRLLACPLNSSNRRWHRDRARLRAP